MTEPPIENLLANCRLYSGQATGLSLREATGHFLRAASDDEALVVAAAAALPKLPPYGASWLAVVLGTCAENGCKLEDSGPAIVALLRSWLDKLPAVEESGSEMRC